ncbi:hypothetical protein GCM10009753_03870 [Streptantibioticus ferralitis]
MCVEATRYCLPTFTMEGSCTDVSPLTAPGNGQACTAAAAGLVCTAVGKDMTSAATATSARTR